MDMGDAVPVGVKETPEERLACVAAPRQRHAEDCRYGRVMIMTGPNTAGVNASEAAVIATRDFACRHGIRRSSHIAEYKRAVASVKRLYGDDGVVAWMHRLDALGPDLLAVHAVQVAVQHGIVLNRAQQPSGIVQDLLRPPGPATPIVRERSLDEFRRQCSTQ
jgi:cytosine/adenosine deaminase-related metal-dependent hydrolase